MRFLILFIPMILSAKMWVIPYGHSSHYVSPGKNHYWVEKHNFSGIAYDYETDYTDTVHASSFINSIGKESNLFSAVCFKKEGVFKYGFMYGIVSGYSINGYSEEYIPFVLPYAGIEKEWLALDILITPMAIGASFRIGI